MFGKKKEEEKKEDLNETCDTCGHIFDKSTGKFIYRIHFRGYTSARQTIVWFCSEHKPLYDREDASGFSTYYFREMKVGKDGTPLGFQPIPPSSPNKKK